jgi:hypothetical protein
MKKIYSVLATAAIIATIFLPQPTNAQSPQKMSYQAVVRDADNALVSNQPVGMQISILQGSASGTAVYVETQTPNSNANGLVTLEIGSGTVLNGDFSSIDWSAGPYFLKTEIDPSGGIDYSITGTSQLLSVPYALYAEKSGSSIWNKNNNDIYYNEGNVGIGVENPEEILDINGTLQLKGTAGDTIPKIIKMGPDLNGQYSYFVMSGDEGSGLELNYNGYWNGSEEIDVDPTHGRSAFSLGRSSHALQLWTAETTGSNHTNQSAKFVVDYNGNVGIGTTEPQQTLDVNGGIMLKGTAGDAIPKMIKLGPDQNGQYSYIVMSGDDLNGLELNYNGYWTGTEEVDVDPAAGRSALSLGRENQALRLWTAETTGTDQTNRTTKFVVGFDGKVGIGTDSPGAKLQVQEGDVYVETIGKGVIISSPDGQCWRITVDNSGNLATSSVTCP